MKLKEGVLVSGIKPEMVVAMMVIQPILEKEGAEFVVTSITDGKHSENSLHYEGLAIDVRVRDIAKQIWVRLAAEIHIALGEEYDVVLEEDHIHVEFDNRTTRTRM